MIVEAVLALTRPNGESYESFIERVLSYGEPAVSVKQADIPDNIARLHGPWESRRAQYLQALVRLQDFVPAVAASWTRITAGAP